MYDLLESLEEALPEIEKRRTAEAEKRARQKHEFDQWFHQQRASGTKEVGSLRRKIIRIKQWLGMKPGKHPKKTKKVQVLPPAKSRKAKQLPASRMRL